MINAKTKFVLIPPGSHLQIDNIVRIGNAGVFFDSETEALEWLGLQMFDNKDYYRVVSVSIAMDERKVVNEPIGLGVVDSYYV